MEKLMTPFGDIDIQIDGQSVDYEAKARLNRVNSLKVWVFTIIKDIKCQLVLKVKYHQRAI